MTWIARFALVATALLASAIATAPLSEQTTSPGPAPSQSRIVGTLKTIDVVPNRPGSRCGKHLELTVVAAGKSHVLKLYDPTISVSKLTPFEGQAIEVDLVDDTIVQSLRPVGTQPAAVAALTNLSIQKLC
jgi:hypothetical protein